MAKKQTKEPTNMVVKANCQSCGQEEHFYAGSSDRLCFDCLLGNVKSSQPDAELKRWLLTDKKESIERKINDSTNSTI